MRAVFILVAAFIFIATPLWADEAPAPKKPIFLDDPRGAAFRIPELDGLDPFTRLARPQPAQKPDVGPITIHKIEMAAWPVYIKNQLEIAAESCAAGAAAAAQLHVYALDTDASRAQETAPSYLVDFSPWAGTRLKPCYLGEVCAATSGCLLAPYAADSKDEWTPQPTLKATSWTFALPGNKFYPSDDAPRGLPAFKTGVVLAITLPTDQCLKTEGESNEDPCAAFYQWNGARFSEVRPLSQ